MTRLQALFGSVLGTKHTNRSTVVYLMHTSELLNALNPYATQSRPRNVYQAPPGLVDHPAQQYTPHRSELELAISEPPPP